MWLTMIFYLMYYKKLVPINTLGLMLAVAVLYSYIILFDFINHTKPTSGLVYEIMICRALVIISYYSVVKRYVTLNKNLNKLSRKQRNLLKPRE